MTRKIACITLDVESDFYDPDGRIRLFEDPMLYDRYTRIINENGVKVTAFLVTSLLEKHGDDYDRLRNQIPLEFAIHSHAHDIQNPCSRVDIERAVQAFRKYTGQMPMGYRAPVGQINREGMETLLDLGFRYDSSVYPSFRPGWMGYNNLHLPVGPFRVRRGAQSILEIPFATLTGIRLVFSLSYVKMFGWMIYDLLMGAFSLPDQIAVLTHPHDFYFHLIAERVTASEKPLLLRNAKKAFDLFEQMIRSLHKQGYEFQFLSGLCDTLGDNHLREFPIEKVTR